MCLVVVIIGIIVIVLGMLFAGAIFFGLIALGVATLAGLISAAKNYSRVKGVGATPMICPNCGSHNVRIQREISGFSGEQVNTRMYQRDYQSGNAVINTQHIAICQDCGFDYQYITADEAAQMKKAAATKLRTWILGAILVGIVELGLWAYFTRPKTDDASATKAQTSTESVVKSESAKAEEKAKDEEKEAAPTEEKEESETIEAEPDNPISNFEYTLEGMTVYLKGDLGNSDPVILEPSYVIDGTEFTTDISDFQIESDAKKLIVNEGFTEVDQAIFNSSEIQEVFFPKSMTYIDDYTLAYLRPDPGRLIAIYYAGSEEEWNSIFAKYERKKAKDTESPEELAESLAAKINLWAGHEYDSSLFEYHFNASPGDLTK